MVWGAGEVHSLESLVPETQKAEPMDVDNVELSTDMLSEIPASVRLEEDLVCFSA